MTLIRWLWLAWVLAGCSLELYALLWGQAGDTLSEIIWQLTHRYPLVALVAGLLMGHWFWQRSNGRH